MTDRVARHVAVYNAAVTSGDWSAFVDLFGDSAELAFVCPQVGPFRGRDAIGAAYRASPPDDTIELIGTTTVERVRSPSCCIAARPPGTWPRRPVGRAGDHVRLLTPPTG